MAVQKKKTNKSKASLKAGRPPTVQPGTKKTMSSKATQKTIVTFHQLQKDLTAAQAKHDTAAATAIESQIEALGGIQAYQAASMQGQSASRGGDSSLVLMKWLAPVKPALGALRRRFKLLEVGALSARNACAKSACFDVTRIDLHSQSPGILQQDFMARPLPSATTSLGADGDDDDDDDDDDDEKFDVISLSLVLNFVPSAAARGEMLRRTTKFLRRRQLDFDPGSSSSLSSLSPDSSSSSSSSSSLPSSSSSSSSPSSPSPSDPTSSSFPPIKSPSAGSIPTIIADYRATLFLVLPSSCVLNSRYFNDERLTLLMASLGYCLLQRKKTSKLLYYLWQLRDRPARSGEQETSFGKRKVREGGGMNNFWVELKPEDDAYFSKGLFDRSATNEDSWDAHDHHVSIIAPS